MQGLDVEFKRCEKQFHWLDILLVYDKSHKHLKIYDSLNAECAARMIQNVELSNISDAYSATNAMAFDINNDNPKHLLWKQLRLKIYLKK